MWQCYYLLLPKSPNKDGSIAAHSLWMRCIKLGAGMIHQSRYWPLIQWWDIGCQPLICCNMSANGNSSPKICLRLCHSRPVAWLHATLRFMYFCVLYLSDRKRLTHSCTCPPVCPCLRGSSRSDNHTGWRPRWWSDCWADIADIILPPGMTWRCPEGKLKRKGGGGGGGEKKKKRKIDIRVCGLVC